MGKFLFSLFCLLTTFCLAFLYGSGSLSVEELGSFLCSQGHQADGDLVKTILLSIRLPRVLLAGLCGGVLSAAGVLSQGVFRNPLASPSVLGASAGGVFGAVLVFFFSSPWMHWYLLPAGAFLGTLLSMSLVLGLVLAGVGRDTSHLLISGFALAILFGSLTSLLSSLLLPDWEKASSLMHWMLGGLSGSGWSHLATACPPAVLGLGLAFFLVRRLDVLALGEDVAESLSVSIRATQVLCISAISLLVASAVSVAGALPFIGLIVPHVTRQILGPSHRRLLPFTILNGMTLLIAADFLCQIVLSPRELEVGSLTSLLGVAFFFAILFKARKPDVMNQAKQADTHQTKMADLLNPRVPSTFISCDIQGEVCKGGKMILRGLRFTIPPGKLSVVVGRNGAGKSTLLRCLAGLEPDFRGDVRVYREGTGSTKLSTLKLRERARLCAWCPAEHSLAFCFSVIDVVVMGRYPHHQGYPGNRDFVAAHEALELMGVADLWQRNVLTLSSGELKKVMLARTLALQSPVVLLDEPEAHLDYSCARTILAELGTLTNKGRTILMTLHNLSLAKELAGDCFVLANGTLRPGRPLDILFP
ncbi:MAG: iron chelate uptake ABC transporter family permease subunit [Deltaproteobacteria bacterium]|nr:iron chelate uptake ABC transporter family permease subunit [Deltaproteobacteria bacterium]